jgi:hypothetical protein|tara:strand:- start:456 stop:599 length:144 start_codon:yes stop_codon:yes gene_type:complete
MLDWIAKNGWRKSEWAELSLLEKGFTFFLVFDFFIFLPLTLLDLFGS